MKRLFGGKKVSPFLDFNINELKQSDAIVRAMQRISVSGVQEKSVRMTLLDHIILADEQYYSFKDNKKL
ncbi:MAG: hypothetical protein IKQ08_10540 [Paludibacteraceae bacterium]|nr:hypothetical protein [Paludibacteraceae bacterium]